MKRRREECFCGEERRSHYADTDKNHKLIINFRDINHTMRSQYEGRGSQKRILIVLLETGTITQRKLTERLGIQPGSVSEVLAKLEKGGLIVRTESPDDRRTTDIALTEQGKRQAEEALSQRRTRHEEMFSCLTEEEKSTLLALLEKVNGDWKTRYENGRR
ncbi:MAG: MarR family transcriptional regulator [Lachnospiraceae bacterium]|nr:MarR family transcriptional regulator [Lachnospiraceae bacterium]